jgi:arabinogalactan endo-1,4-beta-galactosidase
MFVSLTVFAADKPKVTNLVVNPSFEKGANGKNFMIPSWTVVSEKDKDAAFTESGWTHSGQNKFTNWKDSDFKVYVYQTVEKIAEGVYNFEFWYANGDGAKECYVELKDFGGDPVKIVIPKSGSWVKLEAKDIKITTGKCTIGIYSDAKAGYWINMDDFLLYNQKELQ